MIVLLSNLLLSLQGQPRVQYVKSPGGNKEKEKEKMCSNEALYVI